MANEQIKQLVLKQKELLDITAHELRTPIQAISGHFRIDSNGPSLTFAEFLNGRNVINNEFESLIKDKHRLAQFTNGLISAYRNSQRLEKLVNDILDTIKN